VRGPLPALPALPRVGRREEPAAPGPLRGATDAPG